MKTFEEIKKDYEVAHKAMQVELSKITMGSVLTVQYISHGKLKEHACTVIRCVSPNTFWQITPPIPDGVWDGHTVIHVGEIKNIIQ